MRHNVTDYWTLIFVIIGFVGGYIAAKYGDRYNK